ncbi:MAG: 2-isopropylmalate synthase [Lysobacterales bacterium]
MSTQTPPQDRLIIFDTSLRDGEQAPGFGMSTHQKIRLAHGLAQLKVDVIEAGFPAASPGDFEAVKTIANEIQGPTVAALARCNAGDLAAAARALEVNANRRIHTFIATSPIHREHKLKMTAAQVIEAAVRGVQTARSFCDDVEFSAEDALRTEPEYLIEVFQAVIEAGATTLNVPDTVGYATPQEIKALFTRLKKEVRGIDKVILSAHCHNDLGLAVANSLAAVEAGARQVECTINGVGERAGNAALEEIVMAVRTRSEKYRLQSGVDTQRLYATSRLFSSLTGQPVPRNKAVVGENAFAHESGIHQHGVIARRETYEIMAPEDVGFPRSNLVLGKHSGRHALRERLKRLGLEPEEAEMDRIFSAFKRLADRKQEVYDSDLEALAMGHDPEAQRPWNLIGLQIHSATGADAVPIASVVLMHEDGRNEREAAVGDGPVDAAFRAIARVVGIDGVVVDYQVRSVSAGTDAQGQADVRIKAQGESFHGRGVSTDVIEASALAYLDAINRAARRFQRQADIETVAAAARAAAAA